ncbi:MAG: energy-coupling factor transporter ATPase [Bacillota bacterium]
MPPIVEVRGLWHVYGAGSEHEVIALRDVDLVVAEGEFLAVIGHNGSGKSTLAKHLNALLLPTRGDVIVGGMNTMDKDCLWDIRRTAGMVFQNPDNQLVATIVEEDVAFGPENLGLPSEEIRRRVDESLAVVGMSAYAQRPPHLLSGGQKQRVGIAGVLAMRPRLLILDEATAMLDPSGRAEALATARRLNTAHGLTVVHITHFMDEAVAADRVAVMHEGRIAVTGVPREVFVLTAELKAMGLDVPQATELAQRLRVAGFDLPGDVLTVAELAEALCPSR